jgi:hypothetical protein
VPQLDVARAPTPACLVQVIPTALTSYSSGGSPSFRIRWPTLFVMFVGMNGKHNLEPRFLARFLRQGGLGQRNLLGQFRHSLVRLQPIFVLVRVGHRNHFVGAGLRH